MKEKINKIIFGKDRASGIIAISIMMLIALGCTCGDLGKSDPNAKPAPAAFQGDWEGQDGSTLSITADGGGSFKSGNFKVEGGKAMVNEKDNTLSITFIGIGKTLKIDQAPKNGEMKLDGVTYRRKGGFDAADDKNIDDSDIKKDSNKDSKADSGDKSAPFPADDGDKKSADKDMPSDAEVEELIRSTMMDFSDAVETEDFSSFRENSSSAFQRAYTAERAKSSFSVFVNNKDDITPILNSVSGLTPDFSPQPSIEIKNGNKILNIDGSYPTSRTTKFNSKYVLEKGIWKMLTFEVKIGG